MSAGLSAPLDLREKYAWGLRVEPTYEQLIEASKKLTKLPTLDRNAKWYGMSNYRAFILDQSKRYNDYEHLKLDYDQSGARLPARAAAVSSMEESNAFEQADWHDALEYERELASATEAHEEDRMHEAAEMRAEEMAYYAPVFGHWAIEANHEDLEEVGVEHQPPAVHVSVPQRGRPAPVYESVSAGHLGRLRPFPSYQELNLGQAHMVNFMDFHVGERASNYETLRNNALGG